MCILNLIGNILDKDHVGLYRNNSLAIVRNLPGPEIERKNAIIKVFKECGLNIIMQTNLQACVCYFLSFFLFLHQKIAV